MLAIGFLWAALAPVLVLLAIALLAHVLKRFFGVRRYWVAALLGFLLPVAAMYALDRRHFKQVCEQGEPVGLFKKASADGFVLTSQTANSFGTRYLHDDGFKFFETLDYMQGYRGWARYALDAERKIVTSRIPGPTARYEVREEHKSLPGTISIQTVTVLDRETGEVLARARDGSYMGGRMSLFLGAWGSARCASFDSVGGVSAFRLFHSLPRFVFRDGAP